MQIYVFLSDSCWFWYIAEDERGAMAIENPARKTLTHPLSCVRARLKALRHTAAAPVLIILRPYDKWSSQQQHTTKSPGLVLAPRDTYFALRCCAFLSSAARPSVCMSFSGVFAQGVINYSISDFLTPMRAHFIACERVLHPELLKWKFRALHLREFQRVCFQPAKWSMEVVGRWVGGGRICEHTIRVQSS